jgi:polyisoprenoid-binding protein YceI
MKTLTSRAIRKALTLSCILFAASITFSGAARAQEIAIVLDVNRTEIHYTLGALAHTVHGTFKLKSGSIRFDPATGKASGSILVDAISGNSGNDGRDSNMQHNVLESQTYPQIVFTPQQVKGAVNPEGSSDVEVSGIFRLHGQDHPMTWPLSVQMAGSNVTASTHFVIPYQQWGLKNPSTFILRVKDTVEVEVHAGGRIVP